MLFRDELEAVLARFNPWLSADAIRQLIEKLEAIPPTVEGNREMLSWLRGERQWYDEAEKRHRHIQLVDFDAPADNAFHVTWEWALKPPARKGNRADVMFVVNGIPVCVVEHKNPKDGGAIERGITQLRRYEKETPELLGAPQLFNVTHLLDYWYGVTWNANRRFMARWKQEREETYKFAVQSFFEPTDFLRTLQHWILFYVEDGETRKSVLRQHQRIAIDKIVARCEDVAKTARPRLAHAGLGQDLHPADRGAADPRRQGTVPQRDRDPRRRSHRARRSAEGLGREAARRDAAAGHPDLACRLERRSTGSVEG